MNTRRWNDGNVSATFSTTAKKEKKGGLRLDY